MFIYTRFCVNFIWILQVVGLVPSRKTYCDEYIHDEIKELEIVADLFILIIEDRRVIHCTTLHTAHDPAVPTKKYHVF